MKTKLVFLVITFLMFFYYYSISQNTQNEKFDTFFENFSLNPEFQLSRIKFPLLSIRYNDEGVLDTTYLKKEKWKHQNFDFRSGWDARGQLYDNFNTGLKDTDERVFEWRGIGNSIRDQYFFKRIKGKWYLIKNIDYSI